MQGSESCSGCENNEVSIENASEAFSVLSNMMREASDTASAFSSSRYFGTNNDATAITDDTCAAREALVRGDVRVGAAPRHQLIKAI
jgi:hypothetical protein